MDMRSQILKAFSLHCGAISKKNLVPSRYYYHNFFKAWS